MRAQGDGLIGSRFGRDVPLERSDFFLELKTTSRKTMEEDRVVEGHATSEKEKRVEDLKMGSVVGVCQELLENGHAVSVCLKDQTFDLKQKRLAQLLRIFLGREKTLTGQVQEDKTKGVRRVDKVEDVFVPRRSIVDNVDEGLKVVEKVIDLCPKSCLLVKRSEINKQEGLWTKRGDVRFDI